MLVFLGVDDLGFRALEHKRGCRGNGKRKEKAGEIYPVCRGLIGGDLIMQSRFLKGGEKNEGKKYSLRSNGAKVKEKA